MLEDGSFQLKRVVERDPGRWVWLIVGIFGSWKTKVGVRGASKVEVCDNVVLGPVPVGQIGP